MAMMILQEPSYKCKNIKILVSSLGLRMCWFSDFRNIQHRCKDFSFEDVVIGQGCYNQRVLMQVSVLAFLEKDLLSAVHTGIALFLGIYVNQLKCSWLQWLMPWKRMEDI